MHGRSGGVGPGSPRARARVQDVGRRHVPTVAHRRSQLDDAVRGIVNQMFESLQQSWWEKLRFGNK